MSDKLYCIRIPGSDDVFAMPNKEAAESSAEKHNAAISKWYEEQKDLKYLPSLENMKAVVEYWLWDKDSHVQDLAEQEKQSL